MQHLVEQLSGELEAVGAVWAPAEEIDDTDRWRRAVRSAGRLLGWRVRTGITEGRVWAVSEDYEPLLNADREAALWFADLIDRPLPLTPSHLEAQRRRAGRGRGAISLVHVKPIRSGHSAHEGARR